MSRFLPNNAWIGRSWVGRILAIVFLIFLAGVLLKDWVFERYTLTVEVRRVSLPVACNRATRGLFRRLPDQRDFVPEDAEYAYCGWVWTDHGPFKLPQSTAMPWIQTDRATLVHALKVGCRYEVKVIGTGPRPTPDARQPRQPGTIIRIKQALPC